MFVYMHLYDSIRYFQDRLDEEYVQVRKARIRKCEAIHLYNSIYFVSCAFLNIFLKTISSRTLNWLRLKNVSRFCKSLSLLQEHYFYLKRL